MKSPDGVLGPLSSSSGGPSLLVASSFADARIEERSGSGVVARLLERAGLEAGRPLPLLPAPSRSAGIIVGLREDLAPRSDAAKPVAVLSRIRAEGLFWPLPRPGALSPEVLLVDDGRPAGSSAHAAEIAAELTAALSIADPVRIGVLAARPGALGALAELARARAIPVVEDADRIDSGRLRLVRGHRLDLPVVWAALGGLAVEGPNAPGLRWAETVLACAAGRDPWENLPVSLTRAIEILAFLRASLSANRRPTMAFGMSRWKFSVVRPFLAGPDHAPASRNCRSLPEAVESARRIGGRVAAWGNREFEVAEDLCQAAGVPLLRIEDGFVRSVGLGLQRSPPASLVVDQGISYFDASHVSVLETLLQTASFTPALIARARGLREQILAAGLTKYNVGTHEALPVASGRRKLLVPGQVEGDQSLAFGSPRIQTNAALLAAARVRNPEAFILFKPHPDVVTGLRPGAIAAEEVERLADAVVLNASMAECLDWADAVETMTSLTGFEALLRGKAVAAHGLPFYAGWGLTEDTLDPGLPAFARRTRRLGLDELVAATLILNPRYIDPVTLLPAEPELVMRRLNDALHRRPGLADRLLFVYRAGMSLFSHKVYARFERNR